jgi:hypothetical protein
LNFEVSNLSSDISSLDELADGPGSSSCKMIVDEVDNAGFDSHKITVVEGLG